MTIANTAVRLISMSALENNNRITIERDGIHFLIIMQDENIHVMEDRCGHFGVSLKNGTIDANCIRCPVHGAKYDLETGELVNNLFEECDPVNIFLWQKKDGWLEVFI